MALKSQTVPTREKIPHEPDQWFEFLPPSAGDLRDIREYEDHEYNLHLAARMVTSWSYSVPVSYDTLADLDRPTYLWLVDVAIPAHMNTRPEEEKKDLEKPLQDGPPVTSASSRRSSST